MNEIKPPPLSPNEKVEPSISTDLAVPLTDNDPDDEPENEQEKIIKEIISLGREYFFEKKNVKAERQRKLRELIERHTQIAAVEDDS